jgi:adenylate kinase
MRPKYYILLGAPGAGKGTQAALLVESLGIPHVASGDLFRDNMGRGTELGLLAKKYMDEGKLVPDDVTVRMVLDRLAQPDCAKGVILDGFPRTIAQAQALESALSEMGQNINAALYIRVSTEELLKRLGGRYTCKNCQSVYHIVFDPPKQAGVCDKCGGPLYQRADDTLETARKRLDVYFQQTAALIEHYREQGLLKEVNGEQSIEAVQSALLQAVKSR